MGRNPKRGCNDSDIKKNRRSSGRGKMSQGIENAHKKGYETDKKNIRKSDSRQQNSEVIPDPRTTETKGLDPHDPWGEKDAQDGDDHQHNGEKSQHHFCQLERVFLRFLSQVLGENGDESDGQGAFCKETPEQIGDTEGDEKSVCNKAGTKKPGHNHVTDKAEDPTQEGEEPHRSRCLTDLFSLG